MHSDFDIELARQRYLDMIHRYLQGGIQCPAFQMRLQQQWAEERDAIWPTIWKMTRAQQCLERVAIERGETPCCKPSDTCRLTRMMDRLTTLCTEGNKEELFRVSVDALLTAYYRPGDASPEARYIDYPPQINLFERPLPRGRGHRYPCTLEDIRAQLALVPEYDPEGLWAIGLAPSDGARRHAYATYYRWHRYKCKPVIFLYSTRGSFDFRLGLHADPGYIKRHFQVECGFGMEIDDAGARIWCRWPPECVRRYVVEHVLLHEIGHHVQYQQRWRAGWNRWLPSRLKEQFAEDYAIRFNRER